MLVKILGIFDLLAAGLLFILSFNVSVPRGICIAFIIILLLKGAFILTKSIASVFDLAGVVVIVLSFYFDLPRLVFFIPGILILQKGILSVLS